MFCKKCGAKIEGAAKFCPKCGEPVSRNEQESTFPNRIKNNILRHKASYLVIVILVVCMMFLLRSCESNSYTSPLNAMFSGIENKDIEEILKALPDAVVDKVEEESGMDIRKAAEAMGDKAFESVIGDALSYSIDYKINKEETLSLTEINHLKDKIEKEMKVTLDIDEAKMLSITTIVTKDGDKDYDDKTITVIKLGRKWYLNPLDLK